MTPETREALKGGAGTARVGVELNAFYDPKPDITTWELARLVPFIGRKMFDLDWERMPPDLQRHFEILPFGVYRY